MTTRTRTPTKAQVVVNAIRAKLDEANLEIADIRPWGEDCVEVDIIDPHPSVQQAVTAAAKSHQRGGMDITTDAYVNDNRRDDIPQVRIVLVNIKYTMDLYQRAVATAERTFSDCHDTRLNKADCVERLLRGSYPQFWAEETGEEQDPRCCVCRLPVPDTSDAWSLRIVRDSEHRIYRHRECGDFHPTPPARDR